MMSRNEWILIVVSALYFIAGTMSSVFVNVYLYAFTGSLYSMTVYAMIRFSFFPLGFYLGGRLTKYWRLSRVLTLGLSIITLALALLLSINSYFNEYPFLIYSLGFVFGTGEGLFWFSMNSSNLIASSQESRPKFIGTLGITNSTAMVIAPFSASLIVAYSVSDISGYIRIFQVVIVVQIIAALLSTRLNLVRNQMPYTLKDKWNLKNDKQWRYVMTSHFFLGVRDSLILVLTGLLVYNATGGKGSLYGQLLTVFALINVFANFIAAKVIKRNNRIQMYIFGAFILFTSTTVLVLMPNMIGAIYFGVMNALGNPFFINPFSIIMMNAIGDYSVNENIYARMIMKEVALDIGRVLGMSFILIFAFILPESISLIVSVIVASSFSLILVFYAKAYHHKRDQEKLELLKAK